VRYPPEAAAHAASLAEALTRYPRIDEACLHCFAHGFSPRERALKEAYGRSFGRLNEWLERRGGSEDPWDIADAVAALLSRRSAGIPHLRAARKRLRASGKEDLLGDVSVNLLSVLLGSGAQLAPDTFLAFRSQGLLDLAAQLGSRTALQLDWLSLPALQARVEGSSLEELERARDAHNSLFSVLTSCASLLTRTRGLELDMLLAFERDSLAGALIGIPSLVLMHRRFGDQFDENLVQLGAELPRLQAMNRLLDALPPDLHPLFSLDAAGLAALPDPKRERLFTLIRAYRTAHPEDDALLLPESGD
jgi:hypothetical protein